MRYYRLEPTECDRKYCFINGSFACDTGLMRGGPVLEGMREDGIALLEYELDEEQGGLLVGDFLTNLDGHLTLTAACAEAIAASFELGPVELVPARVMNEKGRVHVPHAVVLNPLVPIDCLDWEKSELDGDDSDLMVDMFGAWMLKRDAIPDLDLMRVKGLPGYVFSQRLVDFIEQRGYTNFPFASANLS